MTKITHECRLDSYLLEQQQQQKLNENDLKSLNKYVMHLYKFLVSYRKKKKRIARNYD